jgi:hypothetical protein
MMSQISSSRDSFSAKLADTLAARKGRRHATARAALDRQGRPGSYDSTDRYAVVLTLLPTAPALNWESVLARNA